MSTEYQAVAIFGLAFRKVEEARAFLEEHNVEANDSIDGPELGFECLNAWSGSDPVIGFEMKLGETFGKYQAMWDALFPNCTLQPHGMLEVKVY
jgi:hypothetical protein